MAGFKQASLSLEPKLFLTFDGDNFDPVNRLLVASPKEFIDESGFLNTIMLHGDEGSHPGYRLGMSSLVELEQSDQFCCSFGFYGARADASDPWPKSWAEVAHSSNFQFPNNGSFTVSFLMHRTARESNWRAWALANPALATPYNQNANILRPIIKKNSVFDVRFRDNVSLNPILVFTAPNGTNFEYTDTSSEIINKVCHIVVCWNVVTLPGNNFSASFKVYLNSRLIIDESYSYPDVHPVTNVNSPILIGGSDVAFDQRAQDRNTQDVRLDQIAVYERALTGDEVVWLYKKTMTYDDIVRRTIGITNYWPMSDDESVSSFVMAPLVGSTNGSYVGDNTSIVRERPGPSTVPNSRSVQFQGGVGLIRGGSGSSYPAIFSYGTQSTFEFWFKGDTTNTRGLIFSMIDHLPPYNGVAVYLNSREGNYDSGLLEVRFGDVVLSSLVIGGTGGRFNFANGDWYHVAIVRTTAGKMILYIDGVQHDEQNVSSSSLSVSPGQVYLFGTAPGGLNVRGSMTKLAFYNRALSQEQIKMRAYYAKIFKIRGTITLSGAAYSADIRVYRSHDGIKIAEAKSNANDGQYIIDLLDNSPVDLNVLNTQNRNIRMRAFGPIAPASHEDLP